MHFEYLVLVPVIAALLGALEVVGRWLDRRQP